MCSAGVGVVGRGVFIWQGSQSVGRGYIYLAGVWFFG